VDIRRKVLLERQTLQIGLFESRPTSDACGDVLVTRSLSQASYFATFP
jgi:hypothetical protein